MAINDDWSKPGILYTYYTGTVTGAELVESALKKSGDERLDDIKFVIANWLEVEHVEISADDVKLLVSCLVSISKICPQAKNVTIVKRDKTGNAMLAYYNMLADKLAWTVEIFHSEEEAFDWLGIDAEF